MNDVSNICAYVRLLSRKEEQRQEELEMMMSLQQTKALLSMILPQT